MDVTLGRVKPTVDRMKLEILADVQAGKVAVSCLSFAELHDHVDANEYGSFCDDEVSDKLIEHFGGRDSEGGMPEGMLRFLNTVQDAVHWWMKKGGIKTGSPPPGWEFVDRQDDDPFDRRGIHPYWSVFETQLGGNGTPTYDLTVLQEGEKFFAAHGVVLMPERVDTAKDAAAIALQWYVENGLKPGQTLPAIYSEPVPPLSRTALYSGKVLEVNDGLVVQQVNRNGDTVKHFASNLSLPVTPGDVVVIRYRDGVGVVTGKPTEIAR